MPRFNIGRQLFVEPIVSELNSLLQSFCFIYDTSGVWSLNAICLRRITNIVLLISWPRCLYFSFLPFLGIPWTWELRASDCTNVYNDVYWLCYLYRSMCHLQILFLLLCQYLVEPMRCLVCLLCMSLP